MSESAAVPGRSRTRAPRRNFDIRQNELIDIAIQVFSAKGYVGGTTTDIAKKAGLTQPALYHYVGGKHAFLEEICNRVGRRLREGMESITALDVPAIEQLEAFMKVHAETVLLERHAFRIYATEAVHLKRAARDRLRSDERAYHEQLTEIVARAIADGDLAADAGDPWTVAQVIVGALSWGFRWYRGQMHPEEFAASVMVLLRC